MRIDILHSTAELKNIVASYCDTNRHMYLIFDGAWPGIYEKLYQYGDNPHWTPLFLNTHYQDMLDISPGVVRLDRGDRLLDWYLTEGVSSGILVASMRSLEDVAAHFKTWLEVVIPDEKKQVVLFRFFSPRTLDEFIPSLNPHELSSFLAPVDVLWWSSCATAGEGWNMVTTEQDIFSTASPASVAVVTPVAFAPADASAGQDGRQHYGFRMVSAESHQALNGAGSRTATEEMLKRIYSRYPNTYVLLNKQSLKQCIARHCSEALDAGISDTVEIERLLALRLMYGWYFMLDCQYLDCTHFHFSWPERCLDKNTLRVMLPVMHQFTLIAEEGEEAQKERKAREAEEANPVYPDTMLPNLKAYLENVYVPLVRAEAALPLDPWREFQKGSKSLKYAALARVRKLYFMPEARQGGAQKLLALLKYVYPERMYFLGEEKSKRLLAFAENTADGMDLPMSTGPLCCALAFIFLGSGLFADPFFQEWTGRCFAPPARGNAEQWAGNLLEQCCIDIPKWGSV
jgi:hypothetical protein